MSKELSILILDGDADEVMQIKHALRQGGLHFHSHWVKTKDQFMGALKGVAPDLILSDHGLPSCDGFTALTMARTKLPHVPFIFVVGDVPAGKPKPIFERGGTDFVVKGRLAKLVPAVRRVLHEARRARRRDFWRSLFSKFRLPFRNG